MFATRSDAALRTTRVLPVVRSWPTPCPRRSRCLPRARQIRARSRATLPPANASRVARPTLPRRTTARCWQQHQRIFGSIPWPVEHQRRAEPERRALLLQSRRCREQCLCCRATTSPTPHRALPLAPWQRTDRDGGCEIEIRVGPVAPPCLGGYRCSS